MNAVGPRRVAAIDIGTNSVLLVIAEQRAVGGWQAVLERAEITRLGKGVDASGTLGEEGLAATVAVLRGFATDISKAGAREIKAVATSAVRDANNSKAFLERAKAEAGIDVQVISGDEEAQLSFTAVAREFFAGERLNVLDIGGGSTEIIVGSLKGGIEFRKSFQVGSVRLTERFGEDLAATRQFLKTSLAEIPPAARGLPLVAVAGTATTVCTVAHTIDPYDAAQVHGAVLSMSEVSETVQRLIATPLAERRRMKGLQPKRADVIVAGSAILEEVMRALDVAKVTISDRGLRWGLIYRTAENA